MSIVKPGEGAWYSVDNRITETLTKTIKDDDGRKQIYLRCSDGAGALMYTGLAALWPGHLSMADYIRTTLRGDNRTFEGHGTFLRDRLNRDVARSKWRDEVLIIHIVAFRGGGGRLQNDETIPGRPWVYEVSNCERTPDNKLVLNRNFQFTLKFVEVDVPAWFAAGSGYWGISVQDRKKFTQALNKKPRNNEDYQLLLAAVNRRVGRNRKYRTSPWCQTGFIPPSGIGAQSMDHRKPHEPPFNKERPTPLLYWGIDSTDIAKGLVQLHRLVGEGRGEGDPAYDAVKAALDGAGKKGIRPRS
jgi:hypothetical protein